MLSAAGPEAGRDDDSSDKPYGLDALRLTLVALFVLAFLVLHLYIANEIRTAEAGEPPDLDDLLLAAATGTSGVLGAGFALAMGLKKQEDPNALVGWTAFPKLDASKLKRLILTAGVWGYAAIGVVLVLVWVLNQDETPSVVRATAIGFVGYIVGLATSFFGAIKPDDG